MFNEAENAELTLKRVEEALSPFEGEYEIIVVDDGSVDNTSEMLKRSIRTKWKGEDGFSSEEHRPRKGVKNRV